MIRMADTDRVVVYIVERSGVSFVTAFGDDWYKSNLQAKIKTRAFTRVISVPPARIELAPPAPEAGALSAELQGRLRLVYHRQM